MSRRSALGQQFAAILKGAAEHGIEPADHPGMIRVGGLQVPVTGRYMTINRTTEDPAWEDDHQRVDDSFTLHIPDEQGNLYSIEGSPLSTNSDEHVRGAVWTKDDDVLWFPSAEDFADKYGNIGPPKKSTLASNIETMDMDRTIAALRGATSGEYDVTDYGPRYYEDQLFDPRTGSVRDAAMPMEDAYGIWSDRWEEKQRRQRGR